MTSPKPINGILDIAPYVGGDSKAEGVARAVKLSSNESAIGPSPRAVAAYQKLAGELHRYPDGGFNALRETIAEIHGLAPSRLICGNGSDEIISYLTHAYAGPGDEVLYSAHGFLMYPLSAMAAGARPVKAPETDCRASVDALLGAVTDATKIVFLANPNNPTGTYLTADEVARLRAGLPDHVLLVLDAAYAEYVSRNDYAAGIELVDAGDNVVMTRTFSKIYGLAALRLGWAYCPQAIADVYHRVRPPFNVNAAAQAAGAAAMRDVSHTDAARTHNDIWQPWLTAEMTRLGLFVIPSVANFITVRFGADGPHSATAALAFLKRRGVLARGIAPYGLGDCVRFTIGLEDENRAVVDAVEAFLAGGDA